MLGAVAVKFPGVFLIMRCVVVVLLFFFLLRFVSCMCIFLKKKFAEKTWIGEKSPKPIDPIVRHSFEIN